MFANQPIPQAPVAKTPTAPQAPAIPTSLGNQTSASPDLSRMTYAQLKGRYDELQNQRQVLADRRANVASTYERAHGANQAGIGARLAVMDNSMVKIESDLADVGQAMVNRAQPSTSVPPPPINPGRRGNLAGPEVVLISLAVFAATMLVAVPAAVRRAQRRWLGQTPGSGTTGLGQGNERLDRIEQAVDTIAIEIERVSENQRFMTRLLTETQLAGTIAAVRTSAEAAKSEAAEAG